MLTWKDLADPPDPELAFRRLAHLPWCLWLDSSDARGDTGRWSFLAVDPWAVLLARHGRAWWLQSEDCRETGTGGLSGLVEALRHARDSIAVPSNPGPGGVGFPMPFQGGAAGFLGYELGAEVEILPAPRSSDLGVPDLELGFYDVVVGWDHRSGRCGIASTGLPATGTDAVRRARRRLELVASWIRGEAAPEHSEREVSVGPVGEAFLRGPTPAEYEVPGAAGLRSDFTREGYVAAVREAIEKIRAGDIFQVNLAQRFTADPPPDAAEFYLDLRRRSPAPFAAFFRGSRCTIACASPERFLHVDEGGRIQARPIKGTRRRGDGPREDARLATDLVASGKDRSENLMIADLLRNDLSRVSRPGTVRASELFRLESYATVHHLVSILEGALRPDATTEEVLRATFPCGSVTGAPKIRAMEIISELEPVARGPCYGSIGWLGFDGRLDLNVAIRTVVLTPDRAAFHSGGAVVADSDPDDEYTETLDKARAIAASLSFEI